MGNSKDYAFKLFFYSNQDVAKNIQDFQNKYLEVGIVLHSDVNEKTTGWASTQRSFFRLTSLVNITPPTIIEVENPKVFFVTQTGDIDLKAYAKAFDENQGDITDRIVIDSFPVFNPNKSGTYKVTYSVKNSNNISAVPLQVTIIIWDFAKITSGYYHTLALTTHGKIYTWGYNAFGQLGDGTTTDRSRPQLIEELPDIIDVAAGIDCSYALDRSGQVYSWGRNANGRLGDNTTAQRNRPVKVLQPEGVTFVQISARFATAGGVTNQGDVYTWGYGGYGAGGTGKSNDNHIPTKIAISDIASIEMGYYNGAAVTKNGDVYTWGSNLYGQLGNDTPSVVGPTDPAIVPYFSNANIKMNQVSVGYFHMSGVSEDGRLFTWGYGYEGRLGNGQTTNRFVPEQIVLPSPIKKALAGYYHTSVLTNDGTVYFFGQNVFGKHGSGNATNHLTPYLLDKFNDVTDISIGIDSSFILSQSATVYGMGYGGTGVLGTGNNNNSTSPVKWAFTPPNI